MNASERSAEACVILSRVIVNLESVQDADERLTAVLRNLRHLYDDLNGIAEENEQWEK